VKPRSGGKTKGEVEQREEQRRSGGETPKSEKEGKGRKQKGEKEAFNHKTLNSGKGWVKQINITA